MLASRPQEDCVSNYRLLPVPPDFRGPSGEQHQIEVDGLVDRLELFHGEYDEELDWHVFFDLDAAGVRRIGDYLRSRGESIADAQLAELYCELMLLDDRERRGVTWPPWEASFQWKYIT